ncbi:hypothetical protein [Ancylobacter pratisalsi]|uniref:Uncharacterized protein n=1 Tax=Ancylobacter pratisalsi TaxID=1745854 RepID=A0A6P1YK68_9HYPH|nr:hypothetical protein [Ancylobacter pratisalsi]QIB32623.1 hypothetical protein G3A50_02075 [Ancylobacter pratisalsi]
MITEEQRQIEVAGRHGPEVVGYVIDRATSCLRMYSMTIDPLRKVARQLGYAITTHGSLVKDIDLLAIPWTEDAVEAEVLAAAVIEIIRAADENEFAIVDRDCPRPKPHGRRCWSIHFTGGGFFDFGVMPRGAG